MVNLDDFVAPEQKQAFNTMYGKRLKQTKTLPRELKYAKDAATYYTKGVDWKAFNAATKGTQIVNMHAGMDMFLQKHVDSPMFTIHTDQAPFKMPNPFFQNKMGSFTQHIATETAAPILAKEHPDLKSRIHKIPALPIEPPKKGGLRKLPKGKFNITISGGGLGLNTHDQLETLLKTSNLPKNTEVHVVLGRAGQVGHKSYNPVKVKQVQDLANQAAKKGIKVNVLGFAPLSQLMGEADLNLLRPGGTSITEARASGKPFKIFLHKGLSKGLSARNTWAMDKMYSPELGGKVYFRQNDLQGIDDFFGNMSKQQAAYSKFRVADTGGAANVVDLIRTKKIAKNNPNAIYGRKLKKMGLGALAATSALTYAYRNKDSLKKRLGWKRKTRLA